MSPLFARLFSAVIATLLLAGCATSYVDPQYKNASIADLKRPAAPQRVVLTVEFQTNGSPNSFATNMLRDKAEQALTRSGTVQVAATADAADASRIHIVMNNVADMGDAVAKGFSTGLTFGLVGSLVTDGYTFDASYTPANGKPIARHYEHAIYSTVGNKEGPAGLTPLSPTQAFEQVVLELVTAFLKDLQAEGQLTQLKHDAASLQTALLHELM